MLNVKITLLLISSIFIQNVYLLCENLNAFDNITATVHNTKLKNGYKYTGNFYLLDKYEVIDVNQGNVTELCEGMIKNFPKLQVLLLISVNLSKIQPKSFLGVPKLKELSLAVNHLTEIENESFLNLPELEILYLSGNSIKNLGDKAFQDLPKLKRVYLDRNQLTIIHPAVFKGSRNLHLLDLSFNLLTKIDRSNFPLLEPSFKEQVTYLLGKNNIEEVDPTTFNFPNPVNLHLERNKLSTISVLFHGVNPYSNLFLDGNQFSCLPDDVLDNMKNSTKSISLLNNPINCECLNNIEETLQGYEEPPNVGYLSFNSTFNCNLFKLIP